MIGYQNSQLRFLRLLISWLQFGLGWESQIVGCDYHKYLVGYLVGYHLFLHKNVQFLPISQLRFAAVVYST